MKTKGEEVRESLPRLEVMGADVLIPRLRFPEFRFSGRWDENRLGAISDINPTRMRLGDNLLVSFVPMSSVSEDGYLIGYQTKEYSEVKQGFPFFRDNDVIIAKITPCFENGKAALLSGLKNGCGFGSTEFHVIRAHSGVLPAFLFLYLHSDRIRELGKAHMIGSGGQQRVPSAFFENLQLSFPQVPEQEKIAVCFSSLDDLIAAHADKLEALKICKQGLMQGLFPVEGERVPRLRFPEFRQSGEWETRKISSLLIKTSNPVEVKPNEKYQQIGIRSHGKGIFHKEQVSGQELGSKRVFWVESDAFIVNIVFAWEQAVATTSRIELGMIASHRFPMYKGRPDKSDVNYIKHFFLTKKGKVLLGIASPGGAGRNKTLGQKDFEDISFLIPKDVDEQIKIAATLSSLDDLISAQVQQLKALKEHKKGLMQGLFPATSEAD